MSTLELITKASVTPDPIATESQYPIILDPNPFLCNLKPPGEDSNNDSFIKRVEGWKISQKDTEIIEAGQKFFKKLKLKLKNPRSFTKAEFISMLNSYLLKICKTMGVDSVRDHNDERYYMVIQIMGFEMGQAVSALVLEACLTFEIWEIVGVLIKSGLVFRPYCRNLVRTLIEKRIPDLVCSCVMYVIELQVTDILLALKFFLSPPKDALGAMNAIREDWERHVLREIDFHKEVENKSRWAMDGVVVFMMAHDGFTDSELCLHTLLASQNLDDVMLSACISQLNGSEIMGLVGYLKKWLEKYEKFPQAVPTSLSTLLVPSLENVTKCFGMVVDEHFSSLVMHPEFCEEVKSIELVVNSLVSEARFCCTLANLSASLKIDV